MKYFSMFSGIGGFEYGIEKAYNNKSTHQCTQSKQKERRQGRIRNIEEPETLLRTRENTPLCVGFSEIDKYAIEVYNKHFKHKNYGNARDIKPEELPDFDMLCGGFPCQSFSIAGKRQGFQDTRGTLFHEICRIVSVKRPRLLFLENVKGLLSADDGRCFATIISSLDELGYDVEWQVLNSKNFGVPQNRERVFIIGHLRKESTRQVFPLRESDEVFIEERKQKTDEIAQCITSSLDRRGKGSHIKMIQNSGKEIAKVYGIDGLSPTLKGKSGGWQEPKISVKPILTPDRGNKRQNGRRFKEDGEPSFTLTGQDIHGVMLRDGRERTTEVGFKGQSIRRLTPTECERLQGFPDNFTKYGVDNNGKKIEISDSQRYKCLGNAVTTNVIRSIVKEIIQTQEVLKC